METKVFISGKERKLRNNALIPRKYRNTFGRDLIFDMNKLVTSYKETPELANTEVLENITFLMLKEAGEDVGETVEEFLASLENIFDLYNVLDDVVNLWAAGNKTTATSKKK